MRQPPAVHGRLRALILAAGRGHRFGAEKLHALYQNRPLLSHVLTVVEAGCKRGLLHGGVVVVAAGDQRTSKLVDAAGLRPVVNDTPSLGLSHSLRLGLGSLQRGSEGETGAALIFLADQPLVRVEVIEQLVNAWGDNSDTIIRPRYEARRDTPGHPVLVPRGFWSLAGQLEGDLGLNTLPDFTMTATILLDVAGENPDIDTPADLYALENRSLVTGRRPAAP